MKRNLIPELQRIPNLIQGKSMQSMKNRVVQVFCMYGLGPGMEQVKIRGRRESHPGKIFSHVAEAQNFFIVQPGTGAPQECPEKIRK